MLTAVVELCAERPYSELSIQEVAQRAGMHESALQQRWPTRAHLVLEAFTDQSGRRPAPEGASLRDDLISLTHQTARLFEDPSHRQLTIAALAACAELGLDYRGIDPPRQQAINAIFERATARGDLPPTANPPLMAQLLTGAVLHRLIILNEPVDEFVVEQLVDIVIGPVPPGPSLN
ncbi:MAG: TetR/AcrR family transcriptional regulator [Actinomycetota bacterium]